MDFSFLSVDKLKDIGNVFQDSKSVIGLDIGSSSIKIIQLREEKERATLETYGELSTGAYQGMDIGRATALQEDRVTEMIKDLRKEADVTAKKAFISNPLRYSFITLVDLPDMPAAELKTAVPFEARKYIPLPLSEVELNWWPVSPVGGDKKDKKSGIPVLLAATQKEVADRYKRSSEKGGLKVIGNEIEVFSSARSVIGRFQMPVLIIDIGASSTKVTVLEQGSIRASYGIDKGSQDLTMALSQALGVDFGRAEEMKKEGGIINRPETAEMRNTIMPFVDTLLGESERLRIFYRKKTGNSVDKVILAGGGALLPGLLEYATEKFGFEVIIGNPFHTLEYPTFMQPVIKKIAPSFAIAVGLALKALEKSK